MSGETAEVKSFNPIKCQLAVASSTPGGRLRTAEQARRQGSQIPGWDSERLTTLFSRGICRLNVPFDVFSYVCVV